MSLTRTFIAVPVSSGVAGHAQRVIGRMSRVVSRVRWTPTNNLHYTLHFLGELDDQEVVRACRAAERAAASIEGFGLDVTGVGAFPSIEAPRTLWLGAGAGAAEMQLLHSNLADEIAAAGLGYDNRRFIPHLTLGRLGRNTPAAELAGLSEQLHDLSDYAAGTVSVDEVLVLASELSREGSEYHELAVCPLA